MFIDVWAAGFRIERINPGLVLLAAVVRRRRKTVPIVYVVGIRCIYKTWNMYAWIS